MTTQISAPIKVISHVNQNGQIDEGVDIIDAVNTDEKTIQDDPSVVGFEVKEEKPTNPTGEKPLRPRSP